MDFENRFVGPQYNDRCEYFCEFTELLDRLIGERRLSGRHYIRALPSDFSKGVLPVRRRGETVGEVYLDGERRVTDVYMDVDDYDGGILQKLEDLQDRYIGKTVSISLD